MTTTSAPTVRRHPIRGALYGLLLGAGVAIYLVIFSVIVFQLVIPIIVVVAGVVIGISWSLFAPAQGHRTRPDDATPMAPDQGPTHIGSEPAPAAEPPADDPDEDDRPGDVTTF